MSSCGTANMAITSVETTRLDWMAETQKRSEPHDEDLMESINAKDKAALESLMSRHMRSIYAFALSLARNPDDAEDLTQETFVRCWTKAHTYKPGRVKVSTWLHTLTRNAAIDAFRRRKWTLESESETVQRGLQTLADQSTPEASLEEGDRQAIFKASLKKLPERQRTALLLCYNKGFSNKEAAAVLGISLDALVSLLARARRALKSKVDDIHAGGTYT